MRGRHDLTDAEWAIISPLPPDKPRGVPRVDDRRAISGIFHILRTGTPWRDLPERCGPHATVCNRCNRWARQGVRERLFEALATGSPGPLHLIDSSPQSPSPASASGSKSMSTRPREPLNTARFWALHCASGARLLFCATPFFGGSRHAAPSATDLCQP